LPSGMLPLPPPKVNVGVGGVEPPPPPVALGCELAAMAAATACAPCDADDAGADFAPVAVAVAVPVGAGAGEAVLFGSAEDLRVTVRLGPVTPMILGLIGLGDVTSRGLTGAPRVLLKLLCPGEGLADTTGEVVIRAITVGEGVGIVAAPLDHRVTEPTVFLGDMLEVLVATAMWAMGRCCC